MNHPGRDDQLSLDDELAALEEGFDGWDVFTQDQRDEEEDDAE